MNHSKKIRQDRIPAPKTVSCEFVVNNDHLKLIDYSIFGIATIGLKKFEPGENFNSTKIVSEGIEIELPTLRCVRCDQTQPNEYFCAFESIEDEMPFHILANLESVLTTISPLRAKEQAYAKLPINLREPIFALEDYFQRMETTLEEKAAEINLKSIQEKLSLEDSFIAIGSQQMLAVLTETLEKVRAVLPSLEEKDLSLALEFFREKVSRYLMKSPFTHRSYLKPLGYAGDFEMMNLIYQNNDQATSLFGRCMERAVLAHPEPKAVRNRLVYLTTLIGNAIENAKGDIHILSVASGPAEELKLFLSKIDTTKFTHKVHFSLLDQDQGALRYAQKNLRSLERAHNGNLTIDFVNKSIKEVIISGLPEKYDLIYSAGLFDYFTDSVAERAAKSLFNSLKLGGEVVIGNFSASRTNNFGMLALFDWRLILRDEEDLRRLFTFPNSKLTVEQEEEEINLFCKIKRGI